MSGLLGILSSSVDSSFGTITFFFVTSFFTCSNAAYRDKVLAEIWAIACSMIWYSWTVGGQLFPFFPWVTPLVVRSPMHTTGYICIFGQDLSWNVEVTQPLQAVMSHWNTSPMTTYLDNAPARQVLRCIALFQRGKKSRAGQHSRPGNSSRKSSALLPLGFQPVAAKRDSEDSATFQCNHHISLVVNAIQTPLHNIMNIEHSYWQHLNLCFNWHPNKIWCDWPQHLTKLQQKSWGNRQDIFCCLDNIAINDGWGWNKTRTAFYSLNRVDNRG